MSGFSMALGGAKKKAPVVAPTASGFEDSRRDDSTPHAQAVSEIVDGQVDSQKEEVKVIPAIHNTFALGGAQHLRAMLPSSEPTESEAGLPETPAPPVPPPTMTGAAAAPADEDAQAAEAMLAEIRAGGASIFGTDDTERYRRDVETRADSTAIEGYAAMPIEDFGKAYMRGLGWQDDTDGGPEPIEYVPRPSLLGLGAAPKPDERQEAKGKKRFIKPGESREPKKDMIYVDAEGRQRHVKRVGDKLVEREKSGYSKGALHAITSGAHKGLYGRVVSSGGIDADLKVVLRLTMNGEEVTLAASQCEPVRDARLERQQPGFTHQQHQQSAAGAEGARVDGDEAGGDDAERERKRKHKDKHRDRDRDADERADGHQHEQKRHKSKSHHKDRHEATVLSSSGDGGKSGDRSHVRKYWVRESIRVRVVDKRYERGALYNKKGVVVDVSGVDSFSIRLDETGKLYDGLSHAAVETALPKRGGTVIILSGSHQLRRGTLLERRSEDALAMVQLAGDLQVVKCSFDDVAEWVGVLGDQLDIADL